MSIERIEINDKIIEELRERSPKKLRLRKYLLLSGIIGFVGSIIILLFVNAFAGIGLIGFSIWLISKFWTLNETLLRQSTYFIPKFQQLRESPIKQVSFFSFSWSRCAALIIFISLIVWNVSVFTLRFGHGGDTGHWWNLGVFSWAYPLSIVPALLGVGLLIYLIISPNRTIIYESEHLFHIYEIRWLAPWLTEIPKSKIEAIRFNNNRNGPQWFYSVALIFVIMVMNAGFALLEHPYQTNVLHFIHMFITSLLTLIALILLILFQHNYLEIATDDKLYEMWFDTPFKAKNKINEIADFFGLEPKSKQDPDNELQIIGTAKSYYRLVLSLILCFFGIYSIIKMTLIGEFSAYSFLIYGFIIFFKSIKEDFSDRNGIAIIIEKESNILKQKKNFGFIFEYHLIKNITNNSFNESVCRKYPQKIDAFDIAGINIIVVFIIREWIYELFVYEPIEILINNYLVGILESCILIALILMYIYPIDSIVIDSNTLSSYSIQIPNLFNKKKRELSNTMSKTNFQKFIVFIKGNKSIIVKRLCLIIIAIVLSMIFSLLILFYF